MNKIIMITLLLYTGLIIAGCEKTYSVEEFKQNEELRDEWQARCRMGKESKNCQNMRLAAHELGQERAKKGEEKLNKLLEELNKKREAREKAEQERRKKEMEEYQKRLKEKEEREKIQQKKEHHNE
ncbi:Skp family chaperone for outer membrane proteins [Bartonella chomelii]|uniref:EexN family lipoprotein n=2 Tax=Bartonella TaxID=773 RepID=A0A024LR80_9HYPH|nr:EexN family lipoprotein [Bartonella chomelii]MBA9083379.1 Skp family chaperone for outer membrane proteins [Bartonella chomelii]CDP79604.1 hypothetical protein BN1046_00501 [Bartonella schoenbuchensis]CDP79623.1 hypothetical protein BN1046_00520 [Bartonella schoenbuchensis]